MISFFQALDDRFTQSAALRRVTGLAAHPAGLALLALAFLFLMFWRHGADPALTAGEAQGLYVPYRAVTMDDAAYPLAYSDSFNAGMVRSHPPLMSMQLRSMWHKVAGFSGQSSRVFSGVLMALLAAMLTAIVWRKTRDARMTAGALVVFGFNPAMIGAARTAGAAQEVVFLGIAGFLLPLLLATPRSLWLSRIIWVTSGFFIVWAAVSALWGVVFLAALLFSFIFAAALWHAQDGLGRGGRLLCLGAGALIPLVATVWQATHDWPAYTGYIQAAFAEWGGFGPNVAQGLRDLHLAGYAGEAGVGFPFAGGFVAWVFQAFFWFFLLAVTASLRLPNLPLYARLFIMTAAGFFALTLLHPLGQMPWVYAGVIVVAAAVMLRTALVTPWLATGLRAYTALCLVFALAYAVQLSKAPVAQAGFDQSAALLAEMTQATGLAEGQGVLYVDGATWPAAPDDAIAGYEDILRQAAMPVVARGFVIDGAVYHDAVTRFEGREGARALMDEIFSRHVLRGLVVQSGGRGYFYLAPMTAQDPLLVTFADASGKVTKYRGYYRDLVPLRQQLQKRMYLLMTPPGVPLDVSGLAQVQGLRLQYYHAGDKDGMVSAALIDVTQDVVLDQADPRVILMPLTPQWPE